MTPCSVLGNAVQEWVAGIGQTVPRTMPRLWMITGSLVLEAMLWPCLTQIWLVGLSLSNHLPPSLAKIINCGYSLSQTFIKYLNAPVKQIISMKSG